MNLSDLVSLLPVLILIAAALALLVAAAVRRSAHAATWITLTGLGAALLSVPAAARSAKETTRR